MYGKYTVIIVINAVNNLAGCIKQNVIIRSFATVEELQLAVDEFLIYYNNYRGHSSLGWQAPVTRFAGRAVIVRGLAAIPGLEPMAADPQWGPVYCDPPVEITPSTVRDRNALVPLMA